MSPTKYGPLNALAEPSPKRMHDRGVGDVGVALLEFWGRVADVISEYQARLADEAYLQTSEFRRWVGTIFAAFVVVAVGVTCRRRKRQRAARSEG